MSKPLTPRRKASSRNAIALLVADHVAVAELFAEYEKARSPTRKQSLIAQISADLSVHMQIEEELLYPAVTAVLKEKGLVPEAEVEHTGIKDLIAQIDAAGIDADSELLDAQVKVLSEYVEHHVKEEQELMFPRIEASTIDIDELGTRMAARKRDLVALAA